MFKRVLTFTAVAAAVGAALYGAAGHFGVPWAVRTVLEGEAAKLLNRPVTVDAVRFNPWTWTFELEGLSVASREGSGHFLKLGRLLVDASGRSLLEMAPVVDAFEIDGLDLLATLDEANLKELRALAGTSPTSEDPAPKVETAGGLPGFSVNNIRIRNTNLRVVDRKRGIDESVTDLNLTLPFVSTLASARESLVTPEVGLKLNGTPISAKGRTKPFGNTIEAEMKLNVKGLDVARLARLVPALNSPELRLAGAELSTDLSVLFRNPSGASPAKIVLSGDTTLSKVAAESGTGKKKTTLASLKRANLKLTELDPIARRAEVASVTVEGLTASLNASHPLLKSSAPKTPQESAPTKTSETSSATAPWHWSLGEARLTDANLTWKDGTVQPAATVALRKLNAEAKGWGSATERPGSFSLSAETLRGHVSLSGSGRIAPLELSVTAKGEKLLLTDLAGYVKKASGLDVAARTGFNLRADVTEKTVRAQGFANVSDVTLRSAGETLASWKNASLELTGLDLSQRSVSLGKAELTGASVNAVKRTSGLNLLTALSSSDKPAEKTNAASAPTPKGAPAEPWTWSLEAASLKNAAFAFRDETLRPAAGAKLSNVNLTLRNLSSQTDARSVLDLSAKTGGGSINAAGNFSLAPLNAAVDLKVSGIGLEHYSPLLVAYAGLGAKSGTLLAEGALSLKDAKPAPVVGWKGNFALTELDLTNARGAGLMSWKKASLEGIDFASTDPVRLIVRRAAVEAPGEKQTKVVKELSGLASAIAALRGNDKTAQRLEKVNEKLSGTIEIENVRLENGRFSAEGVGSNVIAKTLLEKLSETLGRKLGTAADSEKAASPTKS